MRMIERSSSFKKDYKREAKGKYRESLNDILRTLLELLLTDALLNASYRDHDLIGNWSGYRECHLKPYLLLIYKKIEADRLVLVRLGSHRELFG